MSPTASCAACDRRVVVEDLSAADVTALVAWVRDGDGRWWCTECQSRVGRTPLLTWRVRHAAVPGFDERRQINAEAERWVRLDRILIMSLAVVLIGSLAVVLLLTIT